jgi:hypothetical protein
MGGFQEITIMNRTPAEFGMNRRTFLAGTAGLPLVGAIASSIAAEPKAATTAMSRPTVSARFGFAPEKPEVTPVKAGRPNERLKDYAGPIRFDGELLLDFGRKLTGRVFLEIDGPVDYVYASDSEQMARIVEHAGKPGFCYDSPPSYIRGKPCGRVAGSGDKPVMLEENLSALRLLRLKASGPVTLRRCWVKFSPPHLPLAGSFTCDDADLERYWHMDVYTSLLCTQSNMDALVPVPAPGGGYVSWDGCRRDREVWAGDLRLASLTWMSAYDNVEPIRNSLYMLWQGRHIDCNEAGLIPGSGSTHQTFYEWTFWFLVNAWEYYERTGDRDFLTSLMSPMGLDRTLDWVKRRANKNGFIEATNSWMYVYDVSGEMTALGIVQVVGLEAMARLFDAGQRGDLAQQARELAGKLRKLIPERFFDNQAGAMRMLALDSPRRPHFPIDANAWAVIYGIGDDKLRQACLKFLTRSELQTPVGLRCLWPAFDDSDGNWAARWPAWHWVHNTTVWPYPNGYVALARMLSGDMAGGLATLKAFHKPIDERGHATIWEAMMPDGGLPFGPDGNTLSFCHGWGGGGAHFMHRQVLGISPAAPGFAKMSVKPDLGPLKRAAGSIPTPKGPIRIELERTDAGVKGKLTLPGGIEATGMPQGIDVKKEA